MTFLTGKGWLDSCLLFTLWFFHPNLMSYDLNGQNVTIALQQPDPHPHPQKMTCWITVSPSNQQKLQWVEFPLLSATFLGFLQIHSKRVENRFSSSAGNGGIDTITIQPFWSQKIHQIKDYPLCFSPSKTLAGGRCVCVLTKVSFNRKPCQERSLSTWEC